MRLELPVIACSAALAGCAAGPGFQRPAAPSADHYTAGTQPKATADTTAGGTGAQRFVSGAPLPARWWESFHCAALDALVAEALAHSPTALAARARLREAQADLSAQTGGTLYPQVDAQLGATRERIDPAAFGFTTLPQPPPFDLFNAQVNVSYTLDILGANRRLIEGERAQAEYQAYETQATQLMLAANVVAAASCATRARSSRRRAGNSPSPRSAIAMAESRWKTSRRSAVSSSSCAPRCRRSRPHVAPSITSSPSTPASRRRTPRSRLSRSPT